METMKLEKSKLNSKPRELYEVPKRIGKIFEKNPLDYVQTLTAYLSCVYLRTKKYKLYPHPW